MRILETVGVPPFVGFHHWLSLDCLAVMIVATFHHLCLNFPVLMSTAVAAVNIVVDLHL